MSDRGQVLMLSAMGSMILKMSKRHGFKGLQFAKSCETCAFLSDNTSNCSKHLESIDKIPLPLIFGSMVCDEYEMHPVLMKASEIEAGEINIEGID